MSMHPGGGAASRTLRAVFAVDTTQAERGLDRVAGKAEQTASRMEKAGKSADRMGSQVAESTRRSEPALVRMARSAEQNGEAWRTVGTSLATVGAATVGLGSVVAKTGIAYNTLRQTSTAALTTLLGSAEAATAQMAKLDDFASNSPFARQVFIEAQQQLIGFGMAAENVLPTLDAIQNAVAATGGSNNDIKELVRIIAQVGAAGKITAVDLMQFGQRGVDAATLIGSQMGKTGAEIREAITDGTLDADAAIAALTAGMQERFGGAAENVKDTMAGAFDRVKAAFRDLSASLMSGAVDPTGGGWLVDLTNKIADLMRWFERAPGPIRNTVLAIGGLSGAAALAVGGLMVLVPRAVETYRALQTLDVIGPRTGRAMRGVGTAARTAAGPAMLGALLLTLSKIGQSMLDTGESVNELENRLQSLARGGNVDALIAGADGINDFNAALQGVADPSLWQRIDNGVDDFFNGIFALVTAGHDGREAIDQFRQAIPDLDAALSQMASSSLPDAVDAFRTIAESWDLNDRGMAALINSMPAFRDHLVGVATEMGLTADSATLLAIATGELAPAAEGAAGAQAGLTEEQLAAQEAAAAQEEAIQALRDAYADWISEIGGVSASFATIDGALKAHQEATREWAEGQAAATSSSKDSWEDFYDGFSVNLGAYLDELASMVDAQANWQSNLESLVGRVSGATLDHLARLGPEGAPLVAALVDGTAEELERFDALFAASGQGAGEEWAAGLRGQQAVFNAAARQLGEGAAEEILEAVRAGEMTVAQAVEQYDLKATLEVLAKTDPAAAVLLEYVAEVERTTAVAKVGADTSLALGGVDMWVYDTEQKKPVPLVDADTSPATGEVDSWEADAESRRPTPKVDADDSPARGVTDSWARWVTGQQPSAKVDANTDPAYDAVGTLVQAIGRTWATINVRAKYAGGLNMGGANPLLSSGRAAGGVVRGFAPHVAGPAYGVSDLYRIGLDGRLTHYAESRRGLTKEAYISDHPAHTRDNIRYLREAASWWGLDVVKSRAAGAVVGADRRFTYPVPALVGTATSPATPAPMFPSADAIGAAVADRVLPGLSVISRKHVQDLVDADRARRGR